MGAEPGTQGCRPSVLEHPSLISSCPGSALLPHTCPRSLWQRHGPFLWHPAVQMWSRGLGQAPVPSQAVQPGTRWPHGSGGSEPIIVLTGISDSEILEQTFPAPRAAAKLALAGL